MMEISNLIIVLIVGYLFYLFIKLLKSIIRYLNSRSSYNGCPPSKGNSASDSAPDGKR